MTKRAKELAKARNNPLGWDFDSLKSLYQKYGFHVESARGSHFTVWHEKLVSQATIVNHPGETPPAYVRKAVAMIDELLALEGEDE